MFYRVGGVYVKTIFSWYLTFFYSNDLHSDIMSIWVNLYVVVHPSHQNRGFEKTPKFCGRVLLRYNTVCPVYRERYSKNVG